jgi:hypothetical protein
MTKDAILSNYKTALSQQRPSLEALYQSATQAITKISERWRAGDWSPDLAEAMHLAAIESYSQQIYAGSMFLVLDRWIRSLALDLALPTKEDRLDAGEWINGARLSRLIWATANNFRHYKEWKDDPRAKEAIDVLKAAGIRGTVLDDLYAADVLILIRPKSYEDVEGQIHRIGEELTAKAAALK